LSRYLGFQSLVVLLPNPGALSINDVGDTVYTQCTVGRFGKDVRVWEHEWTYPSNPRRSSRAKFRQTVVFDGEQVSPTSELPLGELRNPNVQWGPRSVSVMDPGVGAFGSDCYSELSLETGLVTRRCMFTGSLGRPHTVSKIGDDVFYCGTQLGPDWMFDRPQTTSLVRLKWGKAIDRIDAAYSSSATEGGLFPPSCGDIVGADGLIHWSVDSEVRTLDSTSHRSTGVFLLDLPFNPPQRRPTARLATVSGGGLAVLTYSGSFLPRTVAKTVLYYLRPGASRAASQTPPFWSEKIVATDLKVYGEFAYVLAGDRMFRIELSTGESLVIRMPVGESLYDMTVVGDSVFYVTSSESWSDSACRLRRASYEVPYLPTSLRQLALETFR
jgi:hypothetical protein